MESTILITRSPVGIRAISGQSAIFRWIGGFRISEPSLVHLLEIWPANGGQKQSIFCVQEQLQLRSCRDTPT